MVVVRAQAPRPAPRRQPVARIPRGPGANSVMAFVNPFSAMRGKKWTDANSAMSVSYRSRSVGTIGSNSDGTLRAIHFRPRLNDGVFAAPVYTAGPPTVFPLTGTGTASDVSDYAAIDGGFSDYRIVAWGVRITSVGKPLDASGWLTISTIPTGGAIVGAPSVIVPRKDVIPIQNGLDVVWFGQPTDIGACEYRFVNDTGIDTINDWSSVTIFAEGCSTDVVLRYELVFDLELLPKFNEITSRLATEAAPYNQSILSSVFDTFRNLTTLSGVNEGQLRSSAFGLMGQAARSAGAGFSDGMYRVGQGMATTAATYAATRASDAIRGPNRGRAQLTWV